MEDEITLEQLFEEELEAVTSMHAALSVIRANMDLDCADYCDITQEIVKLELTGEYIRDRLANRVPCRWL